MHSLHRIAIINGSLGGTSGNTEIALTRLERSLLNFENVKTERITLKALLDFTSLWPQIETCDAYVFATGTYWDSWSSLLQRFFEEATEHEATSLWLGKPAATLVNMHSVGGKEVLSRLQGVLSTLGCLIPPMSGLTYSLANHLALDHREKSEFHADLWQLSDLDVIAHNLVESLREKTHWKTWPVDSGDPHRTWLSG